MRSLLTPNQIVAYNLAKARQLRGWTQDQAAERLAAFSGEHWSKASWSFAERTVDGVRVRQFSADDLFAFSLAFGLPLAWWFMPPGAEDPGVEIFAQAGNPRTGTGFDQRALIDLLFAPSAEIDGRLAATGFADRVKELQAKGGDIDLKAVEATLRMTADWVARVRKSMEPKRGAKRPGKGKR